MRGGGRFGGVVVAHQGQHTAVLRRAGEIGMAEDVAGAVDAGALAVPHAENAIELALAAQLGLLGAPERGGGQLFIDAGLEFDVGGGEMAARAHELLVEAAERRTAIAGEIACGVQTRLPVTRFLHQNGADQRLVAGHKHVRLVQIVFIVEADGSKRHRMTLRACAAQQFQ